MRPPDPTVLEGTVVRLEPLVAGHHAGLARAVAAEPSAFRYYGPIFQPDAVDGWLRQALVERAAGTRLPYAVIERATGAVAGSTSLLDISPVDGRIEIGHTWYGGPWQGTGVNPESKLLLLTYAFDELGAVRVCLKCDARNERSARAIQGIGATYEGTLRKHMRRQDGTDGHRDSAYFSILDDEWPAARARLRERLRALRPAAAALGS